MFSKHTHKRADHGHNQPCGHTMTGNITKISISLVFGCNYVEIVPTDFSRGLAFGNNLQTGHTGSFIRQNISLQLSRNCKFIEHPLTIFQIITHFSKPFCNLIKKMRDNANFINSLRIYALIRFSGNKGLHLHQYFFKRPYKIKPIYTQKKYQKKNQCSYQVVIGDNPRFRIIKIKTNSSNQKTKPKQIYKQFPNYTFAQNLHLITFLKMHSNSHELQQFH